MFLFILHQDKTGILPQPCIQPAAVTSLATYCEEILNEKQLKGARELIGSRFEGVVIMMEMP